MSATTPPSLQSAARSVAAISSAETASKVLAALLEAACGAAPRAALWLRKGGAVVGWRAAGYPAESAARLQGLRLPDDREWPGSEASRGHGRRYGPGESRPWGSFGEPRAAESLVLCIEVAGRPLAYLLAERASGESPWSPEALSIFARTAQLRLEVDLAFRKLRTLQQTSAEAPAPSSSPAADSRPAAHEAPRISRPVPVESGLEEAEPAPADPDTENARAFARLVATDIRLYNEEAVLLGRKHGDLVGRLGDELERGEQTFRTRFPHLGERGIALLYDAYREVLAGGDESLIPNKRVSR